MKTIRESELKQEKESASIRDNIRIVDAQTRRIIQSSPPMRIEGMICYGDTGNED